MCLPNTQESLVNELNEELKYFILYLVALSTQKPLRG